MSCCCALIIWYFFFFSHCVIEHRGRFLGHLSQPPSKQASKEKIFSPTSVQRREAWRDVARQREGEKGRNRNLTRPASGRYRFFVNFGRLHSGKWQFLCRRRRPRRHPSPLELTTIPSFSVTTGSSRPCFGRSQSTCQLQGITSRPCRPRSSRTRGRRWPTGCSKYARTEAAIRRSSASPWITSIDSWAFAGSENLSFSFLPQSALWSRRRWGSTSPCRPDDWLSTPISTSTAWRSW